MISRYLEMRKRVESLYKEAEKLHEDASAFAYANAIQFPEFIDRVCEHSGPTSLSPCGGIDTAEKRLIPRWLVFEVLIQHGHFFDADSIISALPRKPNETARHWMQRLEKEAEQRKKQRQLDQQERERKPWQVFVSPKTGESYWDDRRFATEGEAKTAALEIANAVGQRKLKEVDILCRGQVLFFISWNKAGEARK